MILLRDACDFGSRWMPFFGLLLIDSTGSPDPLQSFN